MNSNELMSILKKANKAYRTGDPIIPDQEYDDLLEQLEKLLGSLQFARFRRTLMDETGKVKHRTIIGSLNKVKAEEPEIFQKWLDGISNPPLLVMDKIDGASIVLNYVNGYFAGAATRGDGHAGEDQTEKFSHIVNQDLGDRQLNMEIRAEVTLTFETFETLQNIDINTDHKNLRNSTVGLLNNKSIYPDKLALLRVIAYEIIGSPHPRGEQLRILKSLGFDTPMAVMYDKNETYHANSLAVDLVSWLSSRKEKAKYMVDGLVICPVSYVGEPTSFCPEKMVAFKARIESVETQIRGIEWNISKGGLLKPVVLLQPCQLNGTTVKRASGYNALNVQTLGLAIGDTVEVYKGGEIIPVIHRVVSKGGATPSLPNICLSCHTSLVWCGVDLKCPNNDCDDRSMKELTYFVGTCQLEGAGASNLKKWGIYSVEDLITWVPENNSGSQNKFYDELVSKVFTLDQNSLLCSMSWNGGGARTVGKMIDHYTIKGLDELAEEPTMIDETFTPAGIGRKTMEKVLEKWFDNMRLVVEIMNDSRWNPINKKPVVAGSALAGKSFCFTGKISRPRKEFEKMVTDQGGELKSVGKGLDYLVAGEKAGSKLDKAAKLGIKVINEIQFLEMAGQ